MKTINNNQDVVKIPSPFIISGTYKKLDYTITQEFICGSMIDKTTSHYINKLTIQQENKIILDTHWIGNFKPAYNKMIALNEIDFILDNKELFIKDPSKCSHRIPATWCRQHIEQRQQKNALRIETVSIQDRCSLKMPGTWTEAQRERSHIDILNGFIFCFGYCNVNYCPGYEAV